MHNIDIKNMGKVFSLLFKVDKPIYLAITLMMRYYMIISILLFAFTIVFPCCQRTNENIPATHQLKITALDYAMEMYLTSVMCFQRE